MPISTDSALPENRVKISEDLRNLEVPVNEQVLGCVGDAWVRRVWFDMPRYCDGTDLSGYTLSVNYRNTDEDEDRYPVNDAVVGTDTITFSWLVGAVACSAPGLTSVSIKAQKLNGDTVEHEFNSTIYYFKVLPANTTGAEPLQEYSDAFTTLMLQWQAEVDEAVAEAPKGKLVGTASGTTAQTVNDAWPTTPESATLYGKSVQDGTPAPDNPVPVQVVGGRNLVNNNLTNTISGVTFTYANSSVICSGTASALAATTVEALAQNAPIKLTPGTYALSITGNSSGVDVQAYDVTNARSLLITTTAGTFTVQNEIIAVVRVRVLIDTTVNETVYIQLEAGTQATPYTPCGCIGLQIGETVTPIDLQGHTLAGLPNGTRDELDIDAAGVKTIRQRTYRVKVSELNWSASTPASHIFRAQFELTGTPLPDTSSGTASNFALSSNYIQKGFGPIGAADNGYFAIGATGITNHRLVVIDHRYATQSEFEANNADVEFVYKLATPQTIELGTITPPPIAPGDTLAIYASLDPEWAIQYEQDPNIVVNALQSSIAPVEGDTASANYAVNSYLIQANQLYRVTSAIATGEAITPGSNCTACTVMRELVRLTA